MVEKLNLAFMENPMKLPVEEFSPQRAYLIDLPPGQIRYTDSVKIRNISVENKKPWTKGILDAMIAVEVIRKQKLATKNRIALNLLDSTVEIAFKEFLVDDSGHYYSDGDLI